MVSAMLCTLLHADVNGQPPREPPPPKPNILERIGNFFYRITNRLERSTLPPEEPVPLYHRRPPKDVAPRGTAKKLPPLPPVNVPAYDTQTEPQARPNGTVPMPNTNANPGPQTNPKQPEPTVPYPADKKETPAPKSTNTPATTTTTNEPSSNVKQGESHEYPVATKVNRPGRVKSPYPPFRELDVTGLPTGSLARDPNTGKIFRVP